jgi:hypothetical protein
MLEAIGLLLAVLDFFNLTPLLERAVNRTAEWLLGLLRYFKRYTIGANEDSDQPGGVFLWIFAIGTAAPALFFTAFAAFRVLSDFLDGKGTGFIRPGKPGLGFIEAGSIGDLLVGMAIMPFLFVVVFMFTALAIVLCTTAFYYLVCLPMAAAIRLMMKTPRGIIGSLGLILAFWAFR